MTSVRREPLVSIIIVTFGTGPIIVDCLDAVARHTVLDHEVIVVDNLPADPSTRTSRMLGDRSDVVLLETDDNLGFGGGNEYGVQTARGEYVCFLNPDAIVGAGWLEPLLAALDDPVVALAAPVFLDPDGRIQEAGQVIFADSFTAAVGGPSLLTGWTSNVFSRDVDYASAACWVVRRQEHLDRGGFDRAFHPAYFEDADYAMRVEAAGQRCRLVATVPVVHHRGAGVARHHAYVAQKSHRLFQDRWARALSGRCAVPTTKRDAVLCRDRLAESRTLLLAQRADMSPSRFVAVWDDAVGLASENPRCRVTLITDFDVSGPQLGAARGRGLEVIVAGELDGPLGEVIDIWARIADDIVHGVVA